MDQQKSKNTILSILPRPSEKPHKSHIGISFSGPMLTGGKDNTRRKIKNDAVVYEPTSPRVSCMGNIKCKYTKDKLRLAGTKLPPAGNFFRPPESSKTENKTKKLMGFMKLFSDLMIPGCGGRKPVAGKINGGVPLYLDKAPSLSTMKRFSSGRDKLSDNIDNDSDEEVIVVPSSAPVMIRNIPVVFDVRGVVGINRETRKEINLWKRRTMQQPKPLLLNNNNNNNNNNI
ncbi:uncharacterized protein At1g76070-like [Bidens hawaiensis]|uniref:uncharacterized protein At1g76070-like n=1 Tax=Bidens hawaiensis TaxID=980011 RepID=UPI004049D255